ncbi:hypothetical protein BZG02_16170 [Labilibaculum filiforme]|uniref:Glycosyl hydrolase family 32 N-terminal domain-containing protein n=1 Tax=Labilibaculum filiforme TaxID=1940526 RepID=A0A2N3HTE6_9BACT|nr:hypothetical protein [Labilibaculum filiforme]PKQ61328.1 hypothetical protein BZG02_16170 [Labilibaculum filiforme]
MELKTELIIAVVLQVLLLQGCKNANNSSNQTVVDLVEAKLILNSGIDQNHPDTDSIKYGFESGDVKKVGDRFHMLVNERFADLPTVNNRFAYWQSADNKQWKRKSTLLQFSYDTTGVVPNSCIYSPKWVYSKKENLWCLFYIQYKSSPSRTDAFYLRYDGEVMCSKSQTKGMDGIAGPFDKGKLVFKKSKTANWEGLQGITGFSPYQVGNKWYALYGSANTENKPCTNWRIGIATTDSLSGQWNSTGENLPLELPISAEAPQVLKLEDCYLALVDEIGGNENFSLLTSKNGLDWTYHSELKFLEKEQWKWKEVRSPIGFFEDKGSYYTYFTTYYKNTDFAPLRQMKFSIKPINQK